MAERLHKPRVTMPVLTIQSGFWYYASMEETLIVRDHDILGGMPVFAGTRVPVKTLFDYLKANHPLDDFLDDFPTVPRQQAQQVIALIQKQFQETLDEAAA